MDSENWLKSIYIFFSIESYQICLAGNVGETDSIREFLICFVSEGWIVIMNISNTRRKFISKILPKSWGKWGHKHLGKV